MKKAKRIRELQQEIQQLRADYKNAVEVDGEAMTEAEFYLYLSDLQNELEGLQNV